MKLRAVITGATGMVGEGVLHECLEHEDVEAVLVLGRRSCGVTHPKLKEIVHGDLHDLSSIESELRGYNACFFCLGVSSIGMSEEEYHKVTYVLTMHVAETLARLDPDMTFCYVSGARTDGTGKGKVMWARVKGRTELALMELPFRAVYNFRPGYMQPTKGLRNTLPAYRYMSWLYPVLKIVARNYVSTLKEMGLAMINAASRGYRKQVLEVKDILELANA